jgi:hypothetical protein
MIVVSAQWQSEVMTVLQGDFEEELRRMSVDRGYDRPIPRDPSSSGWHNSALRYEFELDK